MHRGKSQATVILTTTTMTTMMTIADRNGADESDMKWETNTKYMGTHG